MKHRGSLIVGLLALCALIAILPLVTLQSEFGGADGEAEGVVSQLNPAYTPWAESILEPPGGGDGELALLPAGRHRRRHLGLWLRLSGGPEEVPQRGGNGSWTGEMSLGGPVLPP